MKRFLTILCSFLMMFTSISVLADTPAITEITESGSAEIGIGAEVPSNWKVTLPTRVNLVKQEDDTYKGIFEKVVSGDLSSDKQIRVRPVSNSVVISDLAGGKSDITGTLTDSKTNFLYIDLSNTGRECVITSSALTAGTWEGILTYNISLKEIIDPGFYLADGSLLRSLSVEDVNNYGALSDHSLKSLPKYLGLTDTEINTITKIVVPEMEAPANCSYMFHNCKYAKEIDVSGFDTKNVTDMRDMFCYTGQNTTAFNIDDISNWNTENVTRMDYMFFSTGQNATTFDIGDISGWNTSKVTDMSNMFVNVGYNATTFNLDLSNWDVSKVTNMSYMFHSAGKNATTWSIGDISNWNTENVTRMDHMFVNVGYSTTYSLDLSGWNVNKVTRYDDFNDGVASKITAPVWVN